MAHGQDLHCEPADRFASPFEAGIKEALNQIYIRASDNECSAGAVIHSSSSAIAVVALQPESISLAYGWQVFEPTVGLHSFRSASATVRWIVAQERPDFWRYRIFWPSTEARWRRQLDLDPPLPLYSPSPTVASTPSPFVTVAPPTTIASAPATFDEPPPYEFHAPSSVPITIRPTSATAPTLSSGWTPVSPAPIRRRRLVRQPVARHEVQSEDDDDEEDEEVRRLQALRLMGLA